MVLELAQFNISPGDETAFEAGYRSVVGVLRESAGLLSVRMTRGLESPSRFVLLVEWESLQAHQAFRDSDRFATWRAAIGPYFAGPPQVEHYSDLSDQTTVSE
jgi:heme-degrading monooxygenase HmoA